MAMRAKWVTIGFTFVMFGVAIFAMQFVPRQFFLLRPHRIAGQCRCRRTLHLRQRGVAKPDAALAADRMSTLVHYVGRRYRYLPLNVARAALQAVVVAKDLPGRERLHRRLETLLAASRPPCRASIRSNSARRSAGRCNTG